MKDHIMPSGIISLIIPENGMWINLNNNIKESKCGINPGWYYKL